jgi:hypothetical protein
MSKVKIQVVPDHFGAHTAVYVDGRFAYRTVNGTGVEMEHLKSLVKELQMDDTTEVVPYTREPRR